MPNPVLTKQIRRAGGRGCSSVDGTRTNHDHRCRKTIGSVVAATFLLLLLVVGGAVFGWANAVAVQRWYWLFVVVLLVLVLLSSWPRSESASST